MTIKDFAVKHAELATDHGVRAASRMALSEVSMKALSAATPFVSREIWRDDWDVCLVLDACRHDLWCEVTQSGMRRGCATYPYLAEKTGSHWSVGSASPEWIGKTFHERHRDAWESAGYVTANPFSGKDGTEAAVLDESVYPLAERGLAYLDEVWRDQWPASEDLPTVAPGTLTERGLWAWERRDEYDMNRLVVHYMQPHIPFRSRPEWCDGWNLEGFGLGGGKGKDSWHRVRDGELDANEFWLAYADNLRWVLNEVETWANATDARILITSDHGNAMGEWGQWSHPPRSGNPVLRKVPWVFVDGTGRDDVTPDPVGNPQVVGGSDDVEERLEALGYV